MFGECTYVFSIELAKHFLSFFIFSSRTLINKKQMFEMLHEKIFRILYIYIYISFLYSIFWCLWNTTLTLKSCNIQLLPVLHASLSVLNHLRGDSTERLDNCWYRFAGYNQYTFWVHNYRGFARSFHHAQVRKWVQVMSENTKWVQGR